ncbi:MAG: thioesterase family protein [Planctomycetaceae bacterium]
MQNAPKTGTSYTKTLTVLDKHAVDFAIPELPPVLSTPSLVLLLERTCLELMQPYLEEGDLTVGVQIDLEHLAPSPIGATVTSTARVVQSDGPVVTFQVEARDEKDQLAKGLHKRRVVNAGRLGDRVRRKIESLKGDSQ